MPLTSDLSLNTAKFALYSITAETDKFNDQLMAVMAKGALWYEVGAAKYREMRWNGETPLPKPVVLDSGKSMSIPSRDGGREIPARVFVPDGGKGVKGVFMRIHGGGWVLQSEDQDVMLNEIAQAVGVVAVSVRYRLAPEDPFPKGPEDCYDAGEWLIGHAKEKWDKELIFCGGESAGGHLTVLTTFLLRTRLDFAFRGLILNFGAYDLSMLPQVFTYQKPEVLITDKHIMETYLDVFLPGISMQDRKIQRFRRCIPT